MARGSRILNKVIWSILIALVIFATPSVYADQCGGSELLEGISANKEFKVVPDIKGVGDFLDVEGKFTSYQMGKNKQYIEKGKGKLGKIVHIHGKIYVSNKGDSFVVVNLFGGGISDDRIMIYTIEGKVVKKLGINDMASKEEQEKVSQSESHIGWLKPKEGLYGDDDGDAPSSAYVDDKAIEIDDKDGRIVLETRWGKVHISLKDGKVTKEEKQKEEKQKGEQGGITEEKAKEIALKAVEEKGFTVVVESIKKSADGKQWEAEVVKGSEEFQAGIKVIVIDAESGKVLKVDVKSFK